MEESAGNSCCWVPVFAAGGGCSGDGKKTVLFASGRSGATDSISRICLRKNFLLPLVQEENSLGFLGKVTNAHLLAKHIYKLLMLSGVFNEPTSYRGWQATSRVGCIRLRRL